MDLPDLVEALIEAGETVAAYEHPGYWQDIGQLHDLEEAVRAYEGNVDEFAGRARLEPDPAERPDVDSPERLDPDPAERP